MKAPTVLDTYGNTSSAGSIIAFHQHSDDLAAGDTGLICSFGRRLFCPERVFDAQKRLRVRLACGRARQYLDAKAMARRNSRQTKGGPAERGR